MNCLECGAAVHDGQAFCGKCGTAVPTQAAPLASPQTSSSSQPVLPSIGSVTLTTQVGDFWKLGSLAVILLSLFLPAVSLPAGLAVSPLRLGFFAWIAVLVVLGLGALTAVPAWRIKGWSDVERFLSAAFLGSVLTVFVLVLGVAHIVGSITQSLNSGSGGLLGNVMGGSLSLSVHVGMGLVLAILGTVSWAVATRRAA